MKDKIRWGIAGPGRIAHKFAQDLQLVQGGQLTAIGSRDLGRARSFADQYNAPHSYGSYEELFQSAEIDVVYIATPHNHHVRLALMAMENGKHVLCEKPAGVNVTEVQTMITSAKKNKVFFMEALWSRFNPAIKMVRELVDKNEIGDVGYLNADFAFYALDRDESGRVLNPDLAGGSLLDIGIYPIFLAYLILGKPEKILAISKFHSTGAEVQTSMIFDYPNAQAVLYSGNTTNSEMKAEISGSEGSLYLPPRWHEAQGYTMIRDGEAHNYELPTIGFGYAHEIMEVHDCLQASKIESDFWSHQNSLDLIGLLDRIRLKTGITFPFEA
ncbi:MAG: Gfo/Idh/MocA family protein [Aurantibacter sp.]